MLRRKRLDKAVLREALITLAEALPDTPNAMTVVRMDGTLVLHHGRDDSDTQATAMLLVTDQIGHRLSNGLGLGDLRYTIVSGSDGRYFVLLFADVGFLLGINFRQIRSWDALFSTLWQNLGPLLDVLSGV